MKLWSFYLMAINFRVHYPIPSVQGGDVGQDSRGEEAHFLGFTDGLVLYHLNEREEVEMRT